MHIAKHVRFVFMTRVSMPTMPRLLRDDNIINILIVIDDRYNHIVPLRHTEVAEQLLNRNPPTTKPICALNRRPGSC